MTDCDTRGSPKKPVKPPKKIVSLDRRRIKVRPAGNTADFAPNGSTAATGQTATLPYNRDQPDGCDANRARSTPSRSDSGGPTAPHPPPAPAHVAERAGRGRELWAGVHLVGLIRRRFPSSVERLNGYEKGRKAETRAIGTTRDAPGQRPSGSHHAPCLHTHRVSAGEQRNDGPTGPHGQVYALVVRETQAVGRQRLPSA